MFTACGDDDDPTCVQADWVDTYTGTSDCDGVIEDVTVTLIASGTDNIVIVANTSTTGTEYDPLPINECSIELSETDPTFGSISLNVTLDGDNLTLMEVLTISGQTETCNITATRN